MSSWVAPRLPRVVPDAGTSFIGRLDDLARLEGIWVAVADDSRQVVFVGGEPGVGKTRLVTEIATTLYDHGAVVLWGTSTSDAAVPYGPFVAAIEGLLVGALAGELEPVLGESAAQLGRLTPQVWRHRPDLAQREPGDSDVRLPLFDAVLDLLIGLAERQPVVLVLEDLQWAGAPPRALLAHLVRSTARSRLLVLATHRTTAPDRNDEFTYAMADLYRHDGVHRIDLAGFGTDEVADYLVREARLRPSAARRSATVLRDHTAGNPFFVRELWRELADAGGIDALRSGTARAPTSVRDTLHRRLAALPGVHAEVIELAAVAGDTFDAAVLLEASEHPRDVTLAALDTGVGAGLFGTDPNGSAHYHFVHALARQAVLERLPASRRTRSHLAIARALEQRPVKGPEAVAQLAHHYDVGHTLGNAADAVRYLVQAAEHAERSLAYEDAATRYLRAAELAVIDGCVRPDLRLAAAHNTMCAGAFVRARELYERLARSDDPEIALPAAVGHEEASWRPGMHGARSVELLRRALQLHGTALASAIYVRGLAGLGRALSFTGAAEQAQQIGERAIELARQLDDPQLLGQALRTSLWQTITLELAPDLLDRAVELAGLCASWDDVDQRAPAGFYRSLIGYMHGVNEHWSEGYEDLARAARIGEQPFYRYIAGCGAYAMQFARGQLSMAAATVAGLDEVGAELGQDATEGSYGVQMFMLGRASDTLEQVRPLIDGDERIDAHWPPALLALYVELDMRGPCARVLDHLMEHVDGYRRDGAQWAGVLAFLVEAAVYLRDADAAAQLRPLVAAHRGTNLVAGQFVAVFGSADRYLGQLDSLLGADTADEHFSAALDMDRRMGAVLHQVDTLVAWADHAGQCSDDGSAQRAERLRAEARVLADRIGYRRALRRMGMTPSAGSVTDLPDGLTEREVDVLRLVADGLSNREIGERLFISQNTAANHVRSILIKTGAPNRTRAAIYAVEQGLLDRSLAAPAGAGGARAPTATRPGSPDRTARR